MQHQRYGKVYLSCAFSLCGWSSLQITLLDSIPLPPAVREAKPIGVGVAYQLPMMLSFVFCRSSRKLIFNSLSAEPHPNASTSEAICSSLLITKLLSKQSCILHEKPLQVPFFRAARNPSVLSSILCVYQFALV